MADIIILSRNPDFSETVAQALTHEGGFKPHIAATEDEALDAAKKAKILISDTIMTRDWPIPIIIVTLPIRLSKLMSEIHDSLQKTAYLQTLSIMKDWQISTLSKILTYLPTKQKTLLTDKEIDILQLLVKNAGEVISKDHLLKTIWSIDSVLDTHTLETHIYRLRNKFRELAEDEIIVAENGGYKLKQ